MADDNATSSSPPARQRRSSFAGQTFADLFGTGTGGGHRNSISRTGGENNSPPQQYPGPIASAAAQAQRRRLSVTTLGLSGSQSSASPFGSYRGRRDSDLTSANSASIDESAVEDDLAASAPSAASPFARRVSFGAKALRDRMGSVSGESGGNVPGQNGKTQPSASAAINATSNTTKTGAISSRGDGAKGRGSTEGFNWSDNFRSRAERTASIGGGAAPQGLSGAPQSPSHHARAKSVAVMEPPAREMPRPKEQARPDHFQERILKGDFYMD